MLALYKLKGWSVVACSYKSNGYLYEPPEYPNMICWSRTDTRTNDKLAEFLEICDLTGTRKEINRCLYREKIKKQIAKSHKLEFWRKVRGTKYAEWIVDDYIKRHDILRDDEYPIWRKPVIWKVPAETFRWKYNEIYRCLECINSEVLYDMASKCDILVCGETMRSQYVILREINPQPIFPIENGPDNFSEIIGTPSERFRELNPDYDKVKSEVEPAHLKPVKYKAPVKNEGSMSFEDRLLYGSFTKSVDISSFKQYLH